jgi:hypothetical protein
MIPPAVLPAVVLVLALDLADIGVDFFIQVLLVTRGAEFGAFV